MSCLITRDTRQLLHSGGSISRMNVFKTQPVIQDNIFVALVTGWESGWEGYIMEYNLVKFIVCS